MEEDKVKKEEEKTNDLKNIRHTIVVYLTIAVMTMVAMVVLYTQVLMNAYIPSESMENTLMTGDRVIGNRLAYKFGHDPERFDIVMFHFPDDPSMIYIISTHSLTKRLTFGFWSCDVTALFQLTASRRG